jgi:hypothetical protein
MKKKLVFIATIILLTIDLRAQDCVFDSASISENYFMKFKEIEKIKFNFDASKKETNINLITKKNENVIIYKHSCDFMSVESSLTKQGNLFFDKLNILELTDLLILYSMNYKKESQNYNKIKEYIKINEQKINENLKKHNSFSLEIPNAGFDSFNIKYQIQNNIFLILTISIRQE